LRDNNCQIVMPSASGAFRFLNYPSPSRGMDRAWRGIKGRRTETLLHRDGRDE